MYWLYLWASWRKSDCPFPCCILWDSSLLFIPIVYSRNRHPSETFYQNGKNWYGSESAAVFWLVLSGYCNRSWIFLAECLYWLLQNGNGNHTEKVSGSILSRKSMKRIWFQKCFCKRSLYCSIYRTKNYIFPASMKNVLKMAVPICRIVQQLAIFIKPRAMTGTVPRMFGRIPFQCTAQMWTSFPWKGT